MTIAKTRHFKRIRHATTCFLSEGLDRVIGIIMRNEYGITFLQQDFNSIFVFPDLTITHFMALMQGNVEGDITQLSSLVHRSGLNIIPQAARKIVSTIVPSFRVLSGSFFRSLGYNPRLYTQGFYSAMNAHKSKNY